MGGRLDAAPGLSHNRSFMERLSAPAFSLAHTVIVENGAEDTFCLSGSKTAHFSCEKSPITSFDRRLFRGNSELPLPKAVQGATLAVKPAKASECRLKSRPSGKY